MKRHLFLAFTLFIFASTYVFAEEDATLLESIGVFDKYSNYDAKPTSEQEINKALEKVKNLHKSKRQLKKEREQKGEVLQDGLSGIVKKPYELLQLPVSIYNNGRIIPKGFYQAVFVEKDNNLILKQGYKNVAIIKMKKAKQEPDNDDLYYVYSSQANGLLKINYGSVDKHLERYFKIVD